MLSPALALLLVVSVVGGYADLAALNPCVGKPTGVHPSSEDSLTTAQEVYCEKGGWQYLFIPTPTTWIKTNSPTSDARLAELLRRTAVSHRQHLGPGTIAGGVVRT